MRTASKTFKILTVLTFSVLGIFLILKNNAQAESFGIATSSVGLPPIEDYFEFRNIILDLFDIPHDSTMTIYDIMQGKTKDFNNLPHPIKPPSLQGVLSDLELVFDKKEFTPKQTITGVLVTFTTNLQDSSINWYHNNKLVLSGKGKVSYTFESGRSGSSDIIRAVVTTEKGKVREISKTIRPAKIHLTWSADTYTPLWYNGKALASGGSTVTINAFPSFYIGESLLDRSNLFYEWAINEDSARLDSDHVGYGKSSYTFNISEMIGNKYTIRVHVYDTAKRFDTYGTIIFKETQPMLEFYSFDPLYGVKEWLTGRKSFIKSGDAVAILAEPFYTPSADFSNLQYTWRVNNTKVGNSNSSEKRLRFMTEPGSVGIQNIEASFRSPTNIYRQGRKSVTIDVQ